MKDGCGFKLVCLWVVVGILGVVNIVFCEVRVGK